MKYGWVGAFALASVLLVALPASSQDAASCPVTATPQHSFSVPAPYLAAAPSGVWHGTERFWTMLQADGTWARLPRNAAGYRQKVFWWYPGFDQREGRPDLKVFGRRLDGPESFVHPQPATGACAAGFGGCTILTAIDVPTTGCWELTGTYRGETLTFVVLIAS